MTTPVRHFAGLDGARTIKTQQFLMARLAVEHCVKRETLGIFTGPAGRGKTFAIESATRDLDLPVVRTLFGSNTNRKEVARALLSEVEGVPHKGTYYELSEQLVDSFVTPHVAIIDEAQHLNQDCTFFLRYLLDHPETHVAILLIGAEGLWTKICKDPTLKSRIYRRVEFGNIPLADLLKALPKYHPIYTGVDRELLQELADRCDVVEHRTLAVFTLTAADLLADTSKSQLDEVTMDQSLALISGGIA